MRILIWEIANVKLRRIKGRFGCIDKPFFPEKHTVEPFEFRVQMRVSMTTIFQQNAASGS
jgi:hypothetical protein